MVESIKQYIKASGIATPPCKIVAGISGGADSIVLADIMQRLDYEIIAVHCNFHLRGEESMRDETFVRDFCKRRNICLHVENFDTLAYAKANGQSVEMAARELRYSLFERIMKKNDAAGIFVAHHADDSIETVFLNLLRGTGLKGICGISPVNGNIMRPLLCVGRKDIEAYAKVMHIEYIVDSTNLQNDYMRNKIRNLILPLMEEARPNFRQTMLANMENFAQAENVYSTSIKQNIANFVKTDGINQRLDISVFDKCGFAETLLHEWLKPYGFSPLQTKMAVSGTFTQVGAVMHSGSHRLARERDCFLLCPIHENVYAEIKPEDLLEIEQSDDCSITKDKNTAVFDASKLSGPLTVREWRDGDKFMPFGMNGKTKKVSDFLTDLKIDNSARKNVKVLLSGSKIAWVIGFRTDERFKVTTETAKTVRMKLKHPL